MKLFVAMTVLFLGVVKLTEAARPVSTEVVKKLKDLEPVYKKLQEKVINEVTQAKQKTAKATDSFYQAVIVDKENSLSRSVQLEDDLVHQLNGQAATVESSCVQILRSIVDLNMNVAGAGYTNCVNNVEAGVNGELKSVYKLLQVDESKLFDISLLDVFKGENIISNPSVMIGKLDAKRTEIDGISMSFVSEINAAVNAYSSRLGNLQTEYRSCLMGNESVLKASIEITKNQLVQTCLGAIV